MNKLFSQFFKNNSANKVLKNPLFYFIVTVLIFAIHILHISLHFSHDKKKFLALIFCLLIESIAEGSILCFIGSKIYGRKYLRYPFVIFSAFLPILHLVDFILERLFSLSIWHTIYSVFSQSFANFVELLYATNLPLWTWIAGFCLLFTFGFLFIFLHEKAHHVKPAVQLNIKSTHILFMGLFAFSLYLPVKKELFLQTSVFAHAASVLPLKNVFIKDGGDKHHIRLTQPIFQKSSKIEGEDNLYIFIVESLRNDAITEETAPCLSKIGQNGFRHNFCIAGANGTHLSWYSLFFSQPALMWKKTGHIGSPFLRDLKNSGYKVNVIASARMSYYDMDKQIFGESQEVIDEYFCPKLEQELSAFDADQACFEYLKMKNTKERGKQAFIVFLDATHFGYSLPSNPHIKFSPYVDSVPFISTVFTKMDVQGIKNRYLNTIYALDELFTDFVQDLKSKNSYEQALIMVTSDHGEEFYENGQLFHASHLSNEQLVIPFILKMPKSYRQILKDENTFSHKDMFPLLKAVLANQSFEFKDCQMASRFNFSLAPEETVLISRNSKVLYKYHPSKHGLRYITNLSSTDDKMQDLLIRFFEEVK
jgi:glucan phosphoethanolaminetransferase (alkaline phosphatase superfamily)